MQFFRRFRLASSLCANLTGSCLLLMATPVLWAAEVSEELHQGGAVTHVSVPEPGSAELSSRSSLSAEERLEAIRRALVKASLEGATQVQAVSWIDENGVLRDSASFRSDMKVRGVQVLAYTRDEAGEPEARLAVQAQPSGHEDLVKRATPSVQTAAANTCPKNVAGVHHLIGVDVVLSDRWLATDIGVAKSLIPWSFKALGPVDAPWRLVRRPPLAGSAYEKALTSTPLDQVPWRARLTLTPLSHGTTLLADNADVEQAAEPARGPWGMPVPASQNVPLIEHPTIQVQWQWRVSKGSTDQPLFQASGVVDVLVFKADWEPSVADNLSQDRVQGLLTGWAQDMKARLGCELLTADITQVQGQDLTINAGALTGVKVGNEWLVADIPRIALHTLEPGVVSRTVLAEVTQVTPYLAKLHVLAGRANEVQKNWKAWPADALNEAIPPTASETSGEQK